MQELQVKIAVSVQKIHDSILLFCRYWRKLKKVSRHKKGRDTANYYILIQLLILFKLGYNTAGQFLLPLQNFAFLHVIKKMFLFLRPNFDGKIPKHCLKGVFPRRAGKDAKLILLYVIDSLTHNIVFFEVTVTA